MSTKCIIEFGILIQSHIQNLVIWMEFRDGFHFYGVYRCVNTNRSLTNCLKLKGFYVKYVSDLLVLTHL